MVSMALKGDSGISSVWGTSIGQLSPGAHDEKREGETWGMVGIAAEAQEARQVMQHLTDPRNSLGLPPTPWFHPPPAAREQLWFLTSVPSLLLCSFPLPTFLSCLSEMQRSSWC